MRITQGHSNDIRIAFIWKKKLPTETFPKATDYAIYRRHLGLLMMTDRTPFAYICRNNRCNQSQAI